MFKVKNKTTKQIVVVLDTMCDDFGSTWFLIWDDMWSWRAASNFVPPNVEI